MKRVLVLLAAAVLLVLALVDVYLWLRPAGPSRATAAAVSSPTAAPRVVERPAFTPSVTTEATAVPSAMVAAQAKPAKPVGKRLKPAKPPVAPPVASAPPPPPVERHAFVPNTTAIEGASGPPPSVPVGFDTGGVQAKPVPKIAAQIEFEIQPKPARAGDAYAVRIYLRNEGKKTLKIKELRVGSSLNGARSEGPLTPKLKEVPPEQVALLAEISSVWKANVNAWGLDVTLRSAHGEVYRNSVAWR